MSTAPKLSDVCFRALQLLARLQKQSGLELSRCDAWGRDQIDALLRDVGITDYDRENGGELLVNGQPFVIDFHLLADVPGEPHVVVSGNPGDGFSIVGPFTTHDAASEWARFNEHGDWWIMELPSPEQVLADHAAACDATHEAAPPVVEYQPGVYCRCGDCGDVHPMSAVKPWHECDGLAERLNVGHPLPAGECPACGAWSYPAPGVNA